MFPLTVLPLLRHCYDFLSFFFFIALNAGTRVESRRITYIYIHATIQICLHLHVRLQYKIHTHTLTYAHIYIHIHIYIHSYYWVICQCPCPCPCCHCQSLSLSLSLSKCLHMRTCNHYRGEPRTCQRPSVWACVHGPLAGCIPL